MGATEVKWRKALSKHGMFSELREVLSRNDSGGDRRGGARDVMFERDGELYVWDEDRARLLTLNLRRLEAAEENGREVEAEVMLCVSAPNFPVDRLVPAPRWNLVALIGQRGISVLELPEERYRHGISQCTRKASYNCRTTTLAERLFTTSHLDLLHAAWYPSQLDEPHIVILTSDNIIRIYSISEPRKPSMVHTLSLDVEESAPFPSSRCSFAGALGERAVSFCFGPAVRLRRGVAHLFPGSGSQAGKSVFPMYILYGNGETYLLHSSLRLSKAEQQVMGPLPMHPAAEDNYGYGACSVLCLPSVPNVLVIATDTGTIYHCVVLDREDEVEGERWRSRPAPPISLYVFDSAELELSLRLAPMDDDLPAGGDLVSPITLHHDPLSHERYHCTHEAGVHSAALTWLPNLTQFLADGDMDSLQNLNGEPHCVVEHVLCTKPLASSASSPVAGFSIVKDLVLGPTLLCLTTQYELITRPILSLTCGPSLPLLSSSADSSLFPPLITPSETLEQRVRNILQRDATNPLLRSSFVESESSTSNQNAEMLQLVSRAVQVFREQNVLKLDLARGEIQRSVRLLRQQKEKQQEDLDQLQHDKLSLQDAAERLAEKCEAAREKRNDQMARIRKVARRVYTCLPSLSKSERDMQCEMQRIASFLPHLKNTVSQVQQKQQYQQGMVVRGNYELSSSSRMLTPQLTNCLQTLLQHETQNITELIKQVNEIRMQVDF
uniref:Nucleoporin 88 n=1 Tax=Eptatretus burgeri TaxID=7764 RepID=A0A8C4QS90_EPTBU